MPSILFEVAHKMSGGGGNGPGGMAAAAPSGVSTGGRASKSAQKQVDTLEQIRGSSAAQAKGMKNQPKWWTKALKTMGVQMSLSGILKQSQIFTSVLGSLFQILGAFVDIMLAPWIPHIVPGLRKLADQVPKMRKWAQQFYDWIMGTAWNWLKKWWGILESGDILTYAFKSLWGGLGTALKNFWDETARMLESKAPAIFPDWMKKLPKFELEKGSLESGDGTNGKNGGGGTNGKNGDGLSTRDKVVIGSVIASYPLMKLGEGLTNPLHFRGVPLNPIRSIPGSQQLNAVTKIFTKSIEKVARVIPPIVRVLFKGTRLLNVGIQAGARGIPDRATKPPRGGQPIPRGKVVERVSLKDLVAAKKARTQATWDAAKKRIRAPKSLQELAEAARSRTQATWDAANKKIQAPKSLEELVAASKARTQATWGAAKKQIQDFVPPKPTSTPKVGTSAKNAKASGLVNDFKNWLGPALKKFSQMASRGGSGIKTLAAEGFSKLGILFKGVKGTAFATAAARVAAKFLKAVPFLGAALMGAETTYDLKQMADSDVGWTGDLTSANAWLTEAKGVFASMMGEGKMGGLLGKGVRYVGSKMGGPIGDFFKKNNEVMKRWKKAQSESGAISSGKALDFGVRAITGYGGAAAAFFPLIGQLIGAGVYEAGALSSTGQSLGMGTRKYGDKDFMNWGMDAIMDMIKNSSDEEKKIISIEVAGAPGTMQTGPG